MRTRRPRRIVTGLALCAGGLALLIWAKMKIVGGVPRTAYAEQQPDDPDTRTTPDDTPPKP